MAERNRQLSDCAGRLGGAGYQSAPNNCRRGGPCALHHPRPRALPDTNPPVSSLIGIAAPQARRGNRSAKRETLIRESPQRAQRLAEKEILNPPCSRCHLWFIVSIRVNTVA